jgi:methionyl-tRNA formyltransferase
MSLGILLFASKYVGRELAAYLLAGDTPIKRVIVGNDDDGVILSMAEQARIDAEVYGPATQENLRRSDQRFTWLLNLWSPHILKPETLALADRRLNVHPGLVPHCRGNDNAAWAVRRNLPAGVSLIEMGAAIDSGDIYAQSIVESPFPTSGKALHELLQHESVNLFKNNWPDICSGKMIPTPQADGGSYFRRRDTNRDRVRNGDDEFSVQQLLSWALAHDFYPGTTAEVRIHGSRYSVRVTINELDAGDNSVSGCSR